MHGGPPEHFPVPADDLFCGERDPVFFQAELAMHPQPDRRGEWYAGRDRVLEVAPHRFGEGCKSGGSNRRVIRGGSIP